MIGRGISTYDDDDLDDSRRKVALVLGSSGCLGSAVVQHLRKHLDLKVLGADVVRPRDEDSTATKSMDSFIHLPSGSHATTVADISTALVEGLANTLESEEEIDAIVCACGGWMGDPTAPKPDVPEDEFLSAVQEYSDTVHKMLEMNLYPVLAAGYAANRFMANEGRLCFVDLLSILVEPSLMFSLFFKLFSFVRPIRCHWGNPSLVCNTWNVGIWPE